MKRVIHSIGRHLRQGAETGRAGPKRGHGVGQETGRRRAAGVRPWTLAFAATVVAAGLALAATPWLDLAAERPRGDVLDHFAQVAFGWEYGPETVGPVRVDGRRLVKWPHRVRIAIYGPREAIAEHGPQVRAYVARLAEITGRDIAMTETGPANYAVVLAPDPYGYMDKTHPDILRLFFASEESMREMIQRIRRETNCSGRIRTWGETYQLAAVIVFIPSIHEERQLRRCIQEEIAQGLGLINDSDEVGESIFNEDSGLAELTAHDELLLRILYDDRLTAGMTPKEAVAAAREVLADLRPAPAEASAATAD